MKTRFTIKDISRLTGVPTKTLANWSRDGILNLVGGCRGKGNAAMAGVMDIFAVALVESLRRRGATIGMVRPLARFVTALPPTAIEEAIKRGDTLIVSAGPAVTPRFASPRDSIAIQSGFDDLLIACRIDIAWAILKKGLINEPVEIPTAHHVNAKCREPVGDG